MGDRDIPSVPVTTLAGLTSISDCEYFSFSFYQIFQINNIEKLFNFSIK